MSFFSQPLSSYMSREPETVLTESGLDEVLRMLQQRRFSSVPVLDAAGSPVGVISRTDLIRLGLLQAGVRRTSPALPMPRRTAADVMSQGPLVIEPTASLAEAARTMVRHEVHRLMVVDAGRLVGVVSTLDLAAAVRDARIEAPISARMTSPIVTIEANRPISAADELLAQHHVSAVVVTEDDWPVGMFSQADALASRDLPRDTPVETVLDPAMICLPATTRMFRAAAHAAQLDVRRVIACEGREAVGVLGGLDFARVAADG